MKAILDILGFLFVCFVFFMALFLILFLLLLLFFFTLQDIDMLVLSLGYQVFEFIFIPLTQLGP